MISDVHGLANAKAAPEGGLKIILNASQETTNYC
jgi:hypothetical protein